MGENQVPRRTLDEYDDITPLSLSTVTLLDPPPPPGSSSSSIKSKESTSLKPAPPSQDWKRQVVNSGRHVLLRASLDGEEVVLKGFVMNNYAQRKGFEREISILGKLRNDSIICPGAIVEGSGESLLFGCIAGVNNISLCRHLS